MFNQIRAIQPPWRLRIPDVRIENIILAFLNEISPPFKVWIIDITGCGGVSMRASITSCVWRGAYPEEEEGDNDILTYKIMNTEPPKWLDGVNLIKHACRRLFFWTAEWACGSKVRFVSYLWDILSSNRKSAELPSGMVNCLLQICANILTER